MIARVYAALIRKGLKSLEDIDDIVLREEVRKELDKQEAAGNGEPAALVLGGEKHG